MVFSNRGELLKLVDKLTEVKINVVGDIIVDRYLWGKVERISPEAPVPIVEVKKTEDRLGGAANVAHNLTALGVKTELFGFIGDDQDGEAALQMLKRAKIGIEGVITERGRPTTLKTRVIAQVQQLLRVDKEIKGAPSTILGEALAAAVETHIDTSNGTIVSDYGKGVISPSLMAKLKKAKDAGRLNHTSRPFMLDPYPTNFGMYSAVSIAKPNRKEAERATGMQIKNKDDARIAGEKLLKIWGADLILISLGEDGLGIVSADSWTHLNTIAQDVYDVSGAGDTVSAVFTAALAAGASNQLAGDLANIAAANVISKIGTAVVTTDQLKSDIENLRF